MTEIRKGQAPAPMARREFTIRFYNRFKDPAFAAEKEALDRLEAIAWDAFTEGRKAPLTAKAGPGYADPDYDLSVEWSQTRARLDEAQGVWADKATRSRVLLVCGSARNDGSLAEIYERWVAAHGVILLTPVYWYQSPSPLKLMIDRLVCADGGNPDPTATGGKKPALAKALEMKGWDYPKHLAGRVYGVVVHGDVAGIEGSRRSLCDWLDWIGFIDAGAAARLDRFIGYYEPYATSHEALDRDTAVQEEVRNVARAVAHAVGELRSGRLQAVQPKLRPPRPK